MNGKAMQTGLGLNVKNTFINVDDDDVPTETNFSKRQCSEPAPMGRQFSAFAKSELQMQAVGEEELDDEDFAGPGRQDTTELNGISPLNRQVTEIEWPSWGPMPVAMPLPGLEGLGGPNWQAPYSSFPGDSALSAQEQWPSMLGVQSGAPLGATKANTAQDEATPGEREQDVPPDWRNKTTVMLRNLPNKYSQQMLLEELNTSGFLGSFDFLYLPIDPETNANRGYCFINFTDPSFAWTLKVAYEGRKMGRFNSDKVVSVAPAALQGFEANYAHYSTARVNRGDPSTRPLFLRESQSSGGGGDVAPRRRGGRRSQGSLIDIAARQQKKQNVPQAPGFAEGYIGLQGNLAPSEGKKGGKSAGKGNNKSNPQGEIQVSDQKPRFCPFCGGEAKPDFRFCQFCGASLNFSPGG